MALLPASHAPKIGTSPRPGFLTRGSARRIVFPGNAKLAQLAKAAKVFFAVLAIFADFALLQ
jgi:hypothetical protein